jgi:hypothetical protein
MNCLLVRLVLWFFTLAIFPIPPALIPLSFRVEVLTRVECGALPREPRVDLTARVATRLVEAEFREPDAWYRDDYRIARVTLGLARRGSPIPHIEACYRVLGCHPDHVWPRIVARREAARRESVLQAEPKIIFGGASSPRKPARSVTLAEFERREKAA